MSRYNEYQTDNSCVIADLLRTECGSAGSL